MNDTKADPAPPDLMSVVVSRNYRVLLLVSALIGVPVAVCAFAFLAAINTIEDYVWVGLPKDLGWVEPALWYTVVVLVAAGLIVGLAVAYLPGRGGHLPVKGLGGGSTPAAHLPGVILAALGGLALGVVLGPESPLTALGAGLVMLAFGRSKLRENPQALTVVAAAGSAAAIATVFGNPLVAAVLMLEVVGLAGSQVLLVLLPCVAAAGVGSLVFTGLGSWTGVTVPSLAIPGLSVAQLDVGDLLWTIPIAIVCAILAAATRRLGILSALVTRRQIVLRTTAAGLLVGLCAVAYALITDRSVLDLVRSGEADLPALVSSPQSWPVLALVMLLLFKGLAYGISLGSFRGGPTFPALFLGAALGVLVAPLPGLGVTAGVAIGMTATTTAVLRLPVTSVVLVVLLLGAEGWSQIPVVMLAAVIGLVAAISLDGRSSKAMAELDAQEGPGGAQPATSAA